MTTWRDVHKRGTPERVLGDLDELAWWRELSYAVLANELISFEFVVPIQHAGKNDATEARLAGVAGSLHRASGGVVVFDERPATPVGGSGLSRLRDERIEHERAMGRYAAARAWESVFDLLIQAITTEQFREGKGVPARWHVRKE